MSSLEAISCPNCGRPLGAADVRFEQGIATCKACDSLFRIAQLVGSQERDPATTHVARPKVALPKGMTVEPYGATLRIRRRWRHPVAYFLLFFCVAWDGFLVFWYSMAFGMGAPWIFKVFPIAHLAVGVGLTYYTIALLINRTEVSVDRNQLAIRHQPLPWPGNMVVPVHDIRQLFCKCDITHGRHGQRSQSYSLHVLKSDGTRQKLVQGILDPDQAVFLEQQVEEHLGIDDRRVPGEANL